MDWVCLQDDADDKRGVPASPYIAREARLQVGLRGDYQSCTARISLHGSGHAQLPIQVLLHRSPCAPRHQVPCNTSRVVPGTHRVVSPGTHQSSGPRDVHMTSVPWKQAAAHMAWAGERVQCGRVGTTRRRWANAEGTVERSGGGQVGGAARPWADRVRESRVSQ
jgi:hypothetical protein